MKLEITRQGGEIRVHLKENLSRGCAEGFVQIRKAFLEQPADLALDLSQVAQVGSAGLASLLRLKEFVCGEGRSFRLLNPPTLLRHTLEHAGLKQHIGEGAKPAPPESPTPKPPAREPEPSAPSPGQDERRKLVLDLEGRLAGLQAAAGERDAAVRELALARAASADAATQIEGMERAGLEALGKAAALERRLAEGQEALRQHEAVVQELADKREALAEAGRKLEALERARQEASAKASSLEAELSRRGQELAEALKRVEALQETEAALAEARRREETVEERTAALKGCLTEIQGILRRALPPAGKEDKPEAAHPSGLRMPVFARDPLEDDE